MEDRVFDLVEAPRGCVNCNKQGQSPRSRHKMARGDREGDGPPPQMERKWKSGNAWMTSEEGERGYNLKFLKQKIKIIFLKKMMPNS